MDEQTQMALQQIGLTPDQIQAIMQLGVLAGEVPIQQRMESQASALRANPNIPGPKGIWTGESYTAADPLQFGAAALGSGVAAFQEQQARQRQMEISREQAAARQDYMNALIGALQGPGAGTPPQAPVSPYGK